MASNHDRIQEFVRGRGMGVQRIVLEIRGGGALAPVNYELWFQFSSPIYPPPLQTPCLEYKPPLVYALSRILYTPPCIRPVSNTIHPSVYTPCLEYYKHISKLPFLQRCLFPIHNGTTETFIRSKLCSSYLIRQSF